jgi:hypothetical protein
MSEVVLRLHWVLLVLALMVSASLSAQFDSTNFVTMNFEDVTDNTRVGSKYAYLGGVSYSSDVYALMENHLGGHGTVPTQRLMTYQLVLTSKPLSHAFIHSFRLLFWRAFVSQRHHPPIHWLLLY